MERNETTERMAWTFVKNYKEEITFVYYCANFLLTIVLFGIASIFLRRRDRRDQERRAQEDQAFQTRRAQEDRRDQERRAREDQAYQTRRAEEDRRDHQRREWRQFAERIHSDYSKLKGGDIPHKVFTVKTIFEKLRIHSEVTGLDVLRYMLADVNYQNFASESPQLKSLREDLHTIFVPLNVCSSLLLLGEVPENITQELRYVVDELGKLAKPFFTGEQRRIILTCLEHFGSAGLHNETHELDSLKKLKKIVPYVDSCLKFGGSDRIVSACKFSLNVKFNGSDDNLTFLLELHTDLEDQRYATHFARNFRERKAESWADKAPLWSIEEISDSDSDELVLRKALHEVRVYIHLFLNKDELVEHDVVQRNMTRLSKVHTEVKKDRPIETVIERICDRFKGDLESIQKCLPDHLKRSDFRDNLARLHEQFGYLTTTQSTNTQERGETNA